MLQLNKNFIEMAEQPLVEAISTYDLHICADGAFLKEYGQGSHAWVFSDGGHWELWKGAGPTFSHSDLMTPFRAELSGLTSVLFILHWLCSCNAIEDGMVMIYLLLQLPITVQISPSWVKGCYQRKQKELKHILNETADKLARDFNSTIQPLAKSLPILPPRYEVDLLHNNQVISSRLGQVISNALYETNLSNHIKTRASWSGNTFNKVN